MKKREPSQSLLATPGSLITNVAIDRLSSTPPEESDDDLIIVEEKCVPAKCNGANNNFSAEVLENIKTEG